MKKFAKSLVVATALAVTLSTAAANTAEAKASVTVTNKQVKKKKVTLTEGKKLQLAVKVNGKKVKTKKLSKKVTFKTSKKKVATVSKAGKIKAVKKGTAKITITSKANKKAKYVLKVTVKAKAAATTEATTTQAPTPAATTTEDKTTPASTTEDKTTPASTTEDKTTPASTTEDKTTPASTTEDQTTPVTKEKKTVVTPNESATVKATVTFKDNKSLADIQSDVDKLAKFATWGENAGLTVKLGGTEYVATFVDEHVLINGKSIADSAKAQNTNEVEVEANVKASKVTSLVVFTPASVESVTFGGVTFTDIKADSFKIGTADYKYEAGTNNSIVVTGDAKEALKALETVATVEVKDAE